MSHLTCPLCGKSTALSSFDPSEFDMDIETCSYVGLGRGRGFKKVSTGSILGSDNMVIGLIKNRILDIAYMLMRSGDLPKREIVSRLKLRSSIDSKRIIQETYFPMVYDKKRGRYRMLISGSEEKEDPRISEMIKAIARALGEKPEEDWIIDNWNDEVGVLRYAIDRYVESQKLRLKDKEFESLIPFLLHKETQQKLTTTSSQSKSLKKRLREASKFKDQRTRIFQEVSYELLKVINAQKNIIFIRDCFEYLLLNPSMLERSKMLIAFLYEEEAENWGKIQQSLDSASRVGRL